MHLVASTGGFWKVTVIRTASGFLVSFKMLPVTGTHGGSTMPPMGISPSGGASAVAMNIDPRFDMHTGILRVSGQSNNASNTWVTADSH